MQIEHKDKRIEKFKNNLLKKFNINNKHTKFKLIRRYISNVLMKYNVR